MNQQIFDDVKKHKEWEWSWADIAVYIDGLYATKYYNEKTKSGEALRSAYRRFKRKQKVYGTPTIASAMQSLVGAFANMGSIMYMPSATMVEKETKIPVSLPATFEAPLQIELKNTLVIADLHCPYHHTAALTQALRTKPEQIIIAGDLFDFASISRYTKSEQSRLESDLETAGLVLLELARYAPIFVVSGNHDERLVAKLDTALRFSRVVAMALNGRTPEHEIVVSDYDYCFLGDEYVIGHLSQYSKEPGKVAAQLAAKYQKHVLVGHDHIIGAQTYNGKPDGKYIGASIGSMTDGTKHWYAQRRLNTFPEWAQGYAYIEETGLSLYRGDGTAYFWQDKEYGTSKYYNTYINETHNTQST